MQMPNTFDMAKAYHSYFTKSISLSINIQITIHPLSTDGAIVILGQKQPRRNEMLAWWPNMELQAILLQIFKFMEIF